MFAIIGMIAKLVGALYRIPLTNAMGAEGIGLYQLVFPLYTVLLTATSGGLPAAIAKVTAGFNAVGDERRSRETLTVSLAVVSAVTLAAAVGLVLLRNRIAFIQGNALAALSYLGIAPSLVLVGVISCFRGYYQGSHNMLPSALSQLVEQVVKLFAGLALCRVLLPYGIQYAVLGAVSGVTLSEVAALIGLLTTYVFTRRSHVTRTVLHLDALPQNAFSAEVAAELAPPVEPQARVTRGSLIRRVYRIALPVTLGSLVIPITQVIDSVLVINILTASTGTSLATSLFGLLNGPVNSLVNMPVVVTMAVSVALLPKVSAAAAVGRDYRRTVETALKYSFVIALPTAGALGVFARPILSLLYARSIRPELLDVGTTLLRLGSVTVVYMSVVQVATAVLQGSDRPRVPAVNLVVGATVKVLTTVLLLRYIGIFGAVTASALCYGVTAALDAIALMKRSPIRPSFYRTVFAPLLSSSVALALGYGAYLAFHGRSGLYALITAAGVTLVVYVVSLLLTRCFTRDELSALPLIGNIKTRSK